MELGCGLPLLHAIIPITLRADQVVSGLAVTFLGTGLSSILGEHFVGVATPPPTKFTVAILGGIVEQSWRTFCLSCYFSPPKIYRCYFRGRWSRTSTFLFIPRDLCP